MFKFIDRSPLLSNLIDTLSNLLARQRGLPIIIGIVLLFLGFVFQLINFFAPGAFVEFMSIVFNGVGILSALIGVVLATPLGR